MDGDDWPIPLKGRPFNSIFGPAAYVKRRDILAQDTTCEGVTVKICGFTCVAHDWEAPCQQHGAWGDVYEMMRTAIEMMEKEPGCDIRLLTTPSDEPATEGNVPELKSDDEEG